MDAQYKRIIKQAVAEDLAWGDITTDMLIPENQQGTATIKAKAKGIVAGTEVARQVFLTIDPGLKIDILIEDGNEIIPGSLIAKIGGSVTNILKAERVALNFLQHLSGIASRTAQYVEAVKCLPVQITDTRKTIPGLRVLEKAAVRSGRGKNHRMHLGDGILIKDNHLAILRSKGISLKNIIAEVRENSTDKLTIEVEVISLSEAVEAYNAGADIIMLDNMKLDDMRQAVQLINGRALIEASGGITLDNVRAVAETGVDLISIGALTHSSKALDISLELDEVTMRDFC